MNLIFCSYQNEKTGISRARNYLTKRHEIINYLEEIYGYMPLLYTEFEVKPFDNSWNIKTDPKCIDTL